MMRRKGGRRWDGVVVVVTKEKKKLGVGESESSNLKARRHLVQMEQFKLTHAGQVHVTHEAVHFHEIRVPKAAVDLVKEIRNCVIVVTLAVGIVTIVRGFLDRRRPPNPN